MIKRKCYLHCCDNSHPPIDISENEVFVGRSIETQIRDVACSRKQVAFEANLANYCVVVKAIGENPSTLNGAILEKNVPVQAEHNDVVGILLSNYRHVIVFDPPPPTKAYFENLPNTIIPLSVNDTPNINTSLENKDIKGEPDNAVKDTSDGSHTNQPKSEFFKRKAAREESDDDDAEIVALKRNKTSPNKQVQMEDKWIKVDSGKLLIFTKTGVVSQNKIAAYDVDGTLITTISGNVFAKNKDDWKILYPEVIIKLQKMHKEGFKIVLFTNQSGISTGKLKESDFKEKLERIVKKINVPIQAFVATDKSKYRKPLIGMWEALVKHNDDININLSESYFVGDAAGRPANKGTKKKKDFSIADRFMAMNIGINFFTPEEHFLNKKTEQWIPPEFNPKKIIAKCLFEQRYQLSDNPAAHVILMVGGPGSGKSYFSKTYLEPKNYKIINQDTLRTAENCLKELEQCLQRNNKAVIDNTNPDKTVRKKYIELAKKYNVPIDCFVMKTSYEHAKHNIRFRELTDSSHVKISDIVLNTYKKRFMYPDISEGFASIVDVNFMPKFNNREEEKLYSLYLVE